MERQRQARPVPPVPEFAEDLLAGQRSAIVGVWLHAGKTMTTVDIARELGTSRQGAAFLMDKLSAVLPVYCDGGGRWRWVEGDGD